MDIKRYTLDVDCIAHPIAGVDASDKHWCTDRRCDNCIFQRINAGTVQYTYRFEQLMKLNSDEN